jgi:sigma-B regulation protein RsbU (phosphoserine phosphatase)
MAWWKDATWFQRISLALLVLAIAVDGYRMATGAGLAFGFILFSLTLVFFANRRKILWRVRNRLLLMFFLLGVVPILLILTMLDFSTILVLGQVAANRVRQDLDARIESIKAVSEDLKTEASHSALPESLEEIARRVPRLEAIIETSGKSLSIPSTGASLTAIPSWLGPEFQGLFESEGRFYFGAAARSRTTGAFGYVLIDNETLARITPGIVEVTAMIAGDKNVNVNIGFDPSGSRVSVDQKGVRTRALATHLPPKKAFWDVSIATIVNWPLKTATDPKSEVIMPIASRPSLLMKGIMTERMASIIVSVLAMIGGFLLLVELASVIASILHTRAITRAVHELHQGTRFISAGDFEHQINVRGQNQLSDLAASFNGMTAQIRHYIGEMRKKEKLESELEIARQVQSRLFPRAIPELKTLELAAICLPGRVVSGDYYDFVRLDDHFTAIALGDVSGKGVSAALLMASIQSSLHAQLTFAGSAPNPSLSTATLMALISQQLYESTPPEKYATFFCSVYDEQTGVLRYTNCGHLKPILVRDGKSTEIDGDGMVVGLLPKVSYEQRELMMQKDDLVAIFSDGVPEAESVSEEEFGNDRLAALLVQNSSEPLDKIIQAITNAVEKWAHDPDARDDTTIVLLRKR